jgi:hypothetical protein|tara:strand:- start:307 stop:495 length:189 start_codon:yes stop_codon:yes gene_type:complete
MDADEPEQLYRTLLIEQEMIPSHIISVLIEYYKMSEEEANLVSREYHAKLGEKNGRNRSSRS